jgi:hypothetical protein
MGSVAMNRQQYISKPQSIARSGEFRKTEDRKTEVRTQKSAASNQNP